ncbi:hypothetical protein [Nostoc sp. UHCC 0252]|uniref:hypothetical protein n=1 Tax=Nostoc sp. UHCC 0252 TaxID=3110241 RepID=UPI002B1F2A4D|nr:hypothetical protein [Nostoc sp. UHCC 0252]MEA5602385.1 hypothetical protein [Nostoc sp. UHCC 0252]
MQLITVTNGDRFCHSFVYDNQSIWKNFDSFDLEHKSILAEHKSIRAEHKSILAEHKFVRLLGQWFGIEVWQRQPAI